MAVGFEVRHTQKAIQSTVQQREGWNHKTWETKYYLMSFQVLKKAVKITTVMCDVV